MTEFEAESAKNPATGLQPLILLYLPSLKTAATDTRDPPAGKLCEEKKIQTRISTLKWMVLEETQTG